MNETTDSDMVCSRCGAAFATKSALASHVSSHVTGGPTDPFVCLECGASFSSHEELQEHAGVHGESEISQSAA